MSTLGERKASHDVEGTPGTHLQTRRVGRAGRVTMMVVTMIMVTPRTLMGKLAATDPNPRQELCQPRLTTKTRQGASYGFPPIHFPKEKTKDQGFTILSELDFNPVRSDSKCYD